MALSILDGNQSATTLSTIVTSGQHIPAHTVVSLGTQAISNITSAVSGTAVTFGLVGGTVTANNFTLTNVLQYDGSHYFLKVGGVATTGGTSFPVYVAGSVTVGNSVTIGSLPAISGTVTVGQIQGYQHTTSGTFGPYNADIILVGEDIEVGKAGGLVVIPTARGGNVLGGRTGQGDTPICVYGDNGSAVTISGTVTIGSALPAGTNRIGVVTIGAGTVTIGAGTAQIGSVTANINSLPTDFPTSIANGLVNYTSNEGYFPVSVNYAEPITGTVTLGAGTAQIGSVTASISNSVVTFYPMQGTTVTNSNFTSTTASTTLVSAVAGREVLTVFSEGPGNLFISPGATATTISYQVRLSPGDYWECPQGQLSLLHTAVFSASGSTARVTEVS
jgi:hypothetical protein